MGTSGAGKTTLLNVLAQRVSTGVVTGDVQIDNNPLGESFQRKTGYVQQQDLHLQTTTVREALQFSALLRQPASVSKAEKLGYAEYVINLLDIADFAEAIVGLTGEGLNVEQRKLLSIGVELAANPDFLIFLDEPTSGLDSQSAWATVSLLRRLADEGIAILCTIHQPSSILFQEFDRLLFLAAGGKTVYFGDIGVDSERLIEYLTANGADSCPPDANPAEWMLEVVTRQKDGAVSRDWAELWRSSATYQAVQDELARISSAAPRQKAGGDSASPSEFAMPVGAQIRHTTLRVFQQYWRTPQYIWAKLLLGVLSAL